VGLDNNPISRHKFHSERRKNMARIYLIANLEDALSAALELEDFFMALEEEDEDFTCIRELATALVESLQRYNRDHEG
jgi:hypothetical protein